MHIHLLGIGGTGMASLAGLLLEAGHIVTGSDGKIYPPMSDLLDRLGIVPFEGYDPENVARADPELVIVGNVIRKDNPEAQEVLRRGIRYRSMPAALAELFLGDRVPMVVAGTHGKTTTSTLVSWLLKSCRIDPGFLIGGIGINFDKNYSVGKDPFFVIEGDEYDTAFFDKGPKFLHYRPRALLITSIEFDHADIYRDLNHIISSFKKLVDIVPPDGLIVANSDDESVRSVVERARCRVISYGLDESNDYHPKDVAASTAGTSFKLPNSDVKFRMPLWGEHNLMNSVGALALLIESGQDAEQLSKGLSDFRGVRRRQEIVYEAKGVTIVDDFAHHPTSAKKTIESMRTRFPDRRIWAIFEPRSNTSRRNIFKDEFADALAAADKVIIAKPFDKGDLSKREQLDTEAIAAMILKRGTDAHSIADTEHIVEYVMRGVDAGDVLLVMSNGAFDGLCDKLIEGLGKRKIVADRDDIKPSRVPK